jgi:hypothetical protein
MHDYVRRLNCKLDKSTVCNHLWMADDNVKIPRMVVQDDASA